jgi:hypothetical protein
MIDFFKWIDSLPVEIAWMYFVLIAALMAIAPFVSTLWRAIYVLYSNEKASILDFSWRFIPNQKMGDNEANYLYVKSTDTPIIYEGMAIMLNWHVSGAFRTDVLPLKKRMKGNAAVVTVRKGRNIFTLVAYTWKGKIQQDIIIEASSVRTLNTLNISGETYFGQPILKLSTCRTSSLRFNGIPYTLLSIPSLRKIMNTSLEFTNYKLKSIATYRLYFASVMQKERTAVLRRTENQILVKTYSFNPRPYNQAIEDFKNEQQEII